ncbi:MAG: MBOAT family protein [Roseburia sp.]|nr:MBOAT family protein [Roseburia sp.]MCM1242109.1 MBOAT family protein [Roseburia sp.]
MLFNSYIFIFLFFPICLAGYYILIHYRKKELAKFFLTVMSFWFYGYFQVNYLLIMILSIAGNYLFHILLSREKSPVRAKGLLVLAITANLGVLFYFKYYDFFMENINAVFGTSFLLKHVLLPLGISFFTFQQIGFIVDTYRGEVRECRLLTYALFVSFFPQLIAGPIVKQSEMLPQFEQIGEKKADWEKIYRGFMLFGAGLFKKVILADTFGAAVDHGYANLPLLGRMDAVIVIIAYSLQLYFDFSGYCDMARGIGHMLGLEIPVNFNSPYRAVNIVDFWKRWHITLNRFFTSYVYIPLGGNRRGRMRMYLNLLIVFFLSGIWHGAGWNFIIWGMMHGILYVLTRIWQHSADKRKVTRMSQMLRALRTLLSRICLFVYVSIAWVYFRAQDSAEAGRMLMTAFRGNVQKLSLELAGCFELDELWYVLKVLHLDNFTYSRYILMFFMLIAGLALAMFSRNAGEITARMKGKAASAVLSGLVFVWCVLSFSQVSTFLYFNF